MNAVCRYGTHHNTKPRNDRSTPRGRNDHARLPSVNVANMNINYLLNENIKEDAIIAQLEKSLKLNKKSCAITKPFCEDGLDYLLETCGRVKTSNGSGSSSSGGSPKKRSMEAVSEGSSSSSGGSPKKRSMEAVSEGNSPSFDGFSKKRFMEAVSEESLSVRDSSTSSDEQESSSDSSFDSIVTSIKNNQQKTNVEKFINGGTEGTFMDLCNVEANDDKLLVTLKRQVKGSLNRLAEANMHRIAAKLEILYVANNRNSMNKILTEVVMDSVVSPVRTPERLVLETCMLLTILHANVDMSVGAKLMNEAAHQFDLLFNAGGSGDCKKIDNIILLIAYLYNFKVAGDVLMYDVLSILLERFFEKDVELILLLLRIAGLRLRKNNSCQLKELIAKLQNKATTVKELESGSRATYMLDIVLAIKNNNVEKIPNYDPDHMERLKRTVKSYLHPGCCITPIDMCIDDIIKAGEQGILHYSVNGQFPAEDVNPYAEESNMLVAESVSKLAKTHRMNTDIRRSIFTVLVTSEDYLDAFEKILHLQGKSLPDYEVLNLIVHCSIHEKAYNPYYHHLACRLCRFNRKYMVSLQYSMWDKLDHLDELKKHQVSNLAKFVGYCVIEKGLPLSSFKVVDFSMLNKRMTCFLKEVMLIVLTKSSLESYQLICSKIIGPKLNVFKESLWLYVKHILKSSDIENDSTDFNHLKQRVEIMGCLFGFSS